MKYAVLGYSSPLWNQTAGELLVLVLSNFKTICTDSPKGGDGGPGYLLPWVKGNILENEILGCTVALFKYAQAETLLLKFHSYWNCRKAPWGRSRSALLSAGVLSTTSTWSYFSALIALCRSVAGIMLHLASQSSWNQIARWPNSLAAESSSWAASSPLPSRVCTLSSWLCWKQCCKYPFFTWKPWKV